MRQDTMQALAFFAAICMIAFTVYVGFLGAWIARRLEPYLNEIIEIKKKRLRDRYDEEKAVSKTARGD